MANLMLLVIISSVCISSGEYTPVVKISQGKLRGQKSILNGHHNYLGIPYAVSERFQPPQRPPKWRKMFYATDALVLCPQKIIFPVGSENCTVLNVYTPANTNPYSPIPVMVFFHGGSFFYGSSSITNFDPAYLVNQGVIVVTANYRLGILGFLCLGIKGAAGNMGLKDQVAALRWVRENIRAFGGDPDSVTIFGESAGAASAHLHMLSRMSQGLFKGVIMQSGSAIAPWALNINPIDSAKEAAVKLGTVSDDPVHLLNIFRKAPLTMLLNAAEDSVLHNTYKYCPCIEKEFQGKESFMVDTPYNLIRQGSFSKVPVMMGFNSAEGIFFAGLHNYNSLNEMNRNFANFIPRVFAWESPRHKQEIAMRIKQIYFGNNVISKSTISSLIDFYSDTLTTYSMPRTSELLTKMSSAPVYNYLFSYDGGRNFAKYFMGISTRGVSHADDLFYIFKPSSIPIPIAAKDKLIVHRMTKMWTNFAKTGNPTPELTQNLPVKWIASDSNKTVYMNIDTKMFMIKTPFQKRIQIWEELYRSYGIEGVVPTNAGRKTFND